jgi:MFS family permease
MGIASIGLLSALPYLAAIFGLIVITRSSDRHQERRLHAGIPMIMIGLLLLLGANLGGQSVTVQIVAFTAMGFFLYMYLPLIFTFTTEILPHGVSIPAIAFIGGVGNLFGGFVGPTLVGWLNGLTHDFTIAFSLLAVCGIAGGVLVIAVRDGRKVPTAAGVPAL